MFFLYFGYNRGISGDEDGPLHLHLSHHTRQDLPSDGDIISKGTFLVSVGALNGRLECLEVQTIVLVL